MWCCLASILYFTWKCLLYKLTSLCKWFFLVFFFGKEISLSQWVWVCYEEISGLVDERVSEQVRDVCHNNQIGAT